MKAYQIKNLEAKIKKQEGVIELIKKSLNREGLKAYQVKSLNEKLQKEIRVLNLMIATLERAC